MAIDASSGAGGVGNGGIGGGAGGGVPIQKFKKLRQMLTPEQQDQKLKDVAHLYEKQFLREMMKAMRSTVSESDFMPANNAEKIFREQLDQEYVDKWGDRGGIGLADMIHKQLLERLGPALGIRQAPEKTMGPIKIDEKSLERNAFLVKSKNDPHKAGRVQFQFDLKQEINPAAKSEQKNTNAGLDLDSNESPSVVGHHQTTSRGLQSVQSPWSGRLLGAQQINPSEYLLHIQHDNGLKSQIVFRGQLSNEINSSLKNPNESSTSLLAGQVLGNLHPEAKSLYWSVE